MRRNTKNALISSILVLALCVSMLVGATFAWFTDTASTGVNKIQAGTLQIGLEMKDNNGNWVNAEGQTLGWVAEDSREQDEIFWEPGCTYKLPTLKITNKGNLALQFKVLVNGISGNMELLNALEFSYSYAWYNESSVVDSGSFEGSNLNNLPYEIPCNLENIDHIGATEYDWRGYPLNVGTFTVAGTNMGFYTLQAHMKESAGNEYQGKALENLSITIVATQVAGVESDSFNDTYDKFAQYPETMVPSRATVKTAAELKAVLTAFTDAGSGNSVVTIAEDITLDDGETWTPITVDGYNGAGVVTIEGGNHTISGLDDALFDGGFAGSSGIVIKDLTLTGVNINDSTEIQGLGAFVKCIDSMPKIELNNCHLKNSTITSTGGARVGGLIGWSAGYNNPNDGPVDTYITVTNCSVENCKITAAGSVGGIIGHAGGNAATYHTITGCTVTGTTLNSTDDGDWRVGVVVGTANVGEVTISGTSASGNTLTQTGKTAPGHSNLYGRFVPGDTGKLTIDGTMITG